MREIKFAWVCRNIKFNEIERVVLTDETLLSGDYPSWIRSTNCEVIAKILPTGLTDKNGREIYEGDILAIWVRCLGIKSKPKDELQNCPVIYANDLAAFCIEWPEHNGDLLHSIEPGACEIIGNLYENPELLKNEI